MMRFLKRFWPLIFIIAIWFIFASPYFLKNKVPYPSNYQVNSVPPWSYYQKYWGPVKNNAMPDIIGQIYPWRHFSIELLKQGQIAFWNPYAFSGNPHLANYQSAVFSPFIFLFFIFPFIDAWSILVLLQPLLASLFMFLFMRELKVSSYGSFLSSVVFMFCGFLVVWMAYGTLSMAIAFLPLALFATEKFYNSKKLRYLTLLSLSIPFSFFSGHFQTSLYFLIFVFAFILFKLISSKNMHNTCYIILATLFGLLISLFQILPSIELYNSAVRSEIFIKGGAGIPFNYLITIFAPDFFGNPVTRNDWFGPYAEWSSFIGIIPLTLAFFAIKKGKKTIPLFFFVIGLLFLLLAVESPLINLISFLKFPVLSTSNPTRIIVLFSFSFAVLSGFGVDSLISIIQGKKVKNIIAPFLIVSIFILLAWVWLLVFKSFSSDKMLIAKRNLILPTAIFLGIIIITLLSIKIKKILPIALFYLLLATSFDSFRFANKWMPFDPKERVFADIPIINAIKNNIGYGRYFGNLGDQVNYYGFSSIEGYDPLYIGRYGEFIQSASQGKIQQAQRSVVKLDRNGKYTDRALDLLGVTLIFQPKADTNQGWAYPTWKTPDKFSVLYEDDKFQLFKNKSAMDRIFLFYDYEVITDSKKLLSRFYEREFSFRKTLLLEEDPKIERNQKGEGTAKIISYFPNRVIIEANSNKPALLFLSDNYYLKWKAKINGEEAKIYRADYSFRAVKIPKGESKVEFIYSGFF